jgi:hypothetical protein
MAYSPPGQSVSDCLRAIRTAGAGTMMAAALAAGAAWGTAAAGSLGPVLTYENPQTTVKVAFPAAKIEVDDKATFTVVVAPRSGETKPAKVRGRFGMPDHGHWTSDEQAHEFNGEDLRFNGEFPMPGVYRLRIWLNYPDGTEKKTAVDFTVAPGESLDPKVVP